MSGSTSSEHDERGLIRLLHGELSAEEARSLRLRLGEDPALAARLRELEALWGGLELSPAPAPLPGAARALRLRAEELRQAAEELSWSAAPRWVQAAAAAALIAGIALGAGLGLRPPADLAPDLEAEFGLAEGYLLLLEEPLEPENPATEDTL